MNYPNNYADLSNEEKLQVWKSYHATTPAMQTLKRRSIRYFTQKINGEEVR